MFMQFFEEKLKQTPVVSIRASRRDNFDQFIIARQKNTPRCLVHRGHV